MASIAGTGEAASQQGSDHGTCPSASGDTPDSVVIGFIGPAGRVAPIPTPIPFTPEMSDKVGGQPERVFRLAAPCIAGACAQWNGTHCGLIGAMRNALAQVPDSPPVRCGIRASCVWFRDDGLDACRVCPSITYNPSN